MRVEKSGHQNRREAHKAAAMTKLSIPEMLQGSYDGPLQVGRSLKQVGTFLGAPEHWDIGDDNPFSCQMNYHDFELIFTAENSCVTLTNFWLELWDTPEGEPAPKRHQIRLVPDRDIKVELGPFKPGAAVADVRRELDAMAIEFSETKHNTAFEVTRILHLPNGAELHFFKLKRVEVLMEIHFCTEASLSEHIDQFIDQ